jgi:hypothetical protein
MTQLLCSLISYIEGEGRGRRGGSEGRGGDIFS